MEVAELITPDRVIVGLDVSDKSALLSVMAAKASTYAGVDLDSVLQSLARRESFGSTGIGRGIAIPHTTARGLRASLGVFARLTHPIDFDSVDDKPVDLVFLLLTPPASENENVAALAAVSRRLRDATVLKKLRAAASSEELYKYLTGVIADRLD